MIGDDIVITVLETSGDAIKLGIEAPRDIKILRREIVVQVAESNKESAASAKPEEVAALKALLSA